MRFREWITLGEARFKGFKRQFVAAHPTLPAYVADDLYNNRVGYTLRRILGSSALAPTTNWQGDDTQRASSTKSGSYPIDKILNAHDYGKLKWTPKPVTLTVTPLDFDKRTLQIFLARCFGLLPEPLIRQDAQRMQTQLDLISQRGTDNEPIIIIEKGDKYELLEGWHRAMMYLLYPPDPNIGAPPDQIEMLKRGETNRLDFTKWKPVTIRAFMGSA
jgi:hypothetical protein